MKRLIFLLLFIIYNISLFGYKNLPIEFEYEKFKNEIINNIQNPKDKQFILNCYYFDNNTKIYILRNDLNEDDKEQLSKILNSIETFKIDWIYGRIYSFAFVYSKNDYNYANNTLEGINVAHEKAKINFYKAFDRINIYESLSVLSYFDTRPDKNRELFSLIDKAILYKVEYPDIDTIKLTYYIDIYGDNSLMGIMMSERDIFTENLTSYMGFSYETNYTGVIIDARGELTSYEGYKVKVKPSLFVVINDNEGRLVFDKNNIYPNVIRKKGMVRYTYNISENQKERVGDNPLRIVASGTGDRSGSYIVVTVIDAKRMLSSEKTRKAIQNGNIVIVIDP